MGWQPGKGSRTRLGSLMLGWHRDGKLVYAGNVGSGLDDAKIDWLLERLSPAIVDEPMVEGAPEGGGRIFVRPELVVEVGYSEVTSAGSLRHPVLHEVEVDRAPEGCVAPIDRERLQLAHSTFGTSFPSLQDRTGVVQRDFAVQMLPTILVIGRNGVVDFAFTGMPSERKLRDAISEALESNPTNP